MLSTRLNSYVYVGALFVTIACASAASADVVIWPDTLRFGQVVAIDNDTVKFIDGCGSGPVEALPITDISTIKLNPQCSLSPLERPKGLAADKCGNDPTFIVFVVSFGQSRRVYAKAVALDASGAMSIEMINTSQKLVGPRSKVLILSRRKTCQKYVPASFQWPPDFKLNH